MGAQCFYLSPYSPDMNPVEIAFSQLIERFSAQRVQVSSKLRVTQIQPDCRKGYGSQALVQEWLISLRFHRGQRDVVLFG